MLKIRNLKANVLGNPLLEGLSLTVKEGQIHAIMGPNGAGKSTLAKILAGHPDYEVTEGEVLFKGEDLLPLSPTERALKGLFLSFQQPPEIAGVSLEQFLHHALNAKRRASELPPLSAEEFSPLLEEKMALVGMPSAFKERALNEGFSGGEKKRNEILQMALLQPTLTILDEIDSGLDIDALRTLASSVKGLLKEGCSLLVITHYQRLLDYLEPTEVHILAEGRIVRSGDGSLASALERHGYEKIVAGVV